MKIEDSFNTKKAGVIISGVNSKFDSMEPSEIVQLVGNKVRIVMLDGRELFVNVLDIAISESIIGKKNISIALGEIDQSESNNLQGGLLYRSPNCMEK